MTKWRTDLESGRKIGLGTILKFCEMSKIFFTMVLMEISHLTYEESSVFHEMDTINLRIMSRSHPSHLFQFGLGTTGLGLGFIRV